MPMIPIPHLTIDVLNDTMPYFITPDGHRLRPQIGDHFLERLHSRFPFFHYHEATFFVRKIKKSIVISSEKVSELFGENKYPHSYYLYLPNKNLIMVMEGFLGTLKTCLRANTSAWIKEMEDRLLLLDCPTGEQFFSKLETEVIEDNGKENAILEQISSFNEMMPKFLIGEETFCPQLSINYLKDLFSWKNDLKNSLSKKYLVNFISSHTILSEHVNEDVFQNLVFSECLFFSLKIFVNGR